MFQSSAVLSSHLYPPDTPRMHAIIIELPAIIRCHFCPSEVFLSCTHISFSTRSCQSLRWEPKDLSNNTESSPAESPSRAAKRVAPIQSEATALESLTRGFHSQEYSTYLLTGCQYCRYDNTDKGSSGNVS